MDGAQGGSVITYGDWTCLTMVYDGTQVYLYRNGLLDAMPGLNPYPAPGGLFRDSASDFTVGAVDRDGEIGNFFTGYLAGIAVFDRALTPAEIFAISQSEPS